MEGNIDSIQYTVIKTNSSSSAVKFKSILMMTGCSYYGWDISLGQAKVHSLISFIIFCRFHWFIDNEKNYLIKMGKNCRFLGSWIQWSILYIHIVCPIKEEWTKRKHPQENLSLVLKDVTFHTPPHTWNTAAHSLFMSALTEWKGCCFEPFPAVSLWGEEEKKAPDAHLK